ncbi:hypothetical protein DN403_22170 [Bacillus sp. AY2-1]|nr:hypothetical protein DN403_22170 [Bacillus sp. AY2-1]
MSWSNDCWKHSSHSSKCEDHSDWWKHKQDNDSCKCKHHSNWWKHKQDNNSCKCKRRQCKCFVFCCHSNRKHW